MVSYLLTQVEGVILYYIMDFQPKKLLPTGKACEINLSEVDKRVSGKFGGEYDQVIG